jgi:hypothetical protein
MERLMDFFGLFRRPPPIRNSAELADFIDRQSAFLVQKGIYEYSRARAGHYAKVLFGESGFIAAVEEARWRAYPVGLAMIGELVGGVLRPHMGPDRRAVHDPLIALVLSVMDRYPVPPVVGEGAWRESRLELEHRLDVTATHAPKRAMDIPGPYAQIYFDLMPIHEKLRGRDFVTTHNYLKVTLCNIHEELSNSLDAPAVVTELRQGAVAPETA